MQGAAKVGLLVVVFVALIYGAYIVLGKSFLGTPKSTYYAEFPDAGGVTKGTQVLLAGVQVGAVRDISLIDPRHAKMTLEIDSNVKIPRGSSALLPASLISFGNNPIQIVPPETQTNSYLAVGDTMPGGKGNALDNILPDSKATVQELTATLKATRKLLEDPELTGGLKKLMASTNETIGKFGGLATQLQGTIAENRATLQVALKQASAAMGDVHEATSLVAKMLKSGKLEGQASELLARLNKVTGHADDLVANLNQFVTDPKLREPMNETMANVAKMTDTGTRIADNTEKITKNGEVVSAKAIELADKANELADEAKKVLQDIRGFFGKGPSAKLGNIGSDISLTHESEPSHWRTDLTLNFPLSDSMLYVGMYDAFESNKTILQLGKDVNSRFGYRYGIYASKPSIGVDYRLANRFSFRGDLFDINDPRFDLRARYEFGNGLYGWFGVERLFDKNSPAIGFGIRK